MLINQLTTHRCLQVYTSVYRKTRIFRNAFTPSNPHSCGISGETCSLPPLKAPGREKGIRGTDALRFAPAVGIADGPSYCVALLLALKSSARRFSSDAMVPALVAVAICFLTKDNAGYTI